MPQPDLGNRLRALRLEHGYSIAEVINTQLLPRSAPQLLRLGGTVNVREAE